MGRRATPTMEAYVVSSLQSSKKGFILFGVSAFCASLFGAWVYAKRQDFVFTERVLLCQNDILGVRESQLTYDKMHYRQFRENTEKINTQARQIEELQKAVRELQGAK